MNLETFYRFSIPHKCYYKVPSCSTRYSGSVSKVRTYQSVTEFIPQTATHVTSLSPVDHRELY
jgi:hypothetical protein